MGDDITFVESDKKFVEAESDSLHDFRSVSGLNCKECERVLTVRLDPDPDTLRYTAECDDCNKRYIFKAKLFSVEMIDTTV